ncbi:MAG: LamG-like jellyroll fold domain-containing protein [Verrucomicrobiia bacterium]
MKLKKMCYVASIAMTACLVYKASAQTWTGLGTDDLWSDAANWDTGVPDSNAVSVVIGNDFYGSEATETTIASGDVENCANAVAAGAIFAPQWGATLNIYGTLNFGWVMAPGQWDSTPGNQSVINMYNGSSLNGNGALPYSSTLCFGDTWWAAGVPYVALNMYGNAQVNVPLFAWGGQINMYDTSTFTVTQIAAAGTTSGVWGVAGPTDSTRLWNLAGGTVVLPTGYTATVANWISRGIFLAYGKAYDTTDLSITDNGTTTIVTVPALGTLQNIYLGPSRSSMMVGTFQKPGVFGNFANVSDVPLSALDAAQLGGSTVVYNSTAPSVASVTTNGLVTAVSTGNAIISATLGAFTTTNSVFITVTPFTNSLIHRYSFSESSGSTTADSIGGAAWNGTLYGGATLGGGQVTLDGSSGYVQLPAGIVSGMDAVTIEAWANFGSPQAWAVLYAFGAQDASFSPEGENYITFQPFTGATPPTAQATFGAGDPGNADEQDAILSLAANGVTNYLGNVHVVAVYHPFAGYIAMYTNGVLAAINNNVSNPLALTLGSDPVNYLGQSLYGSDPFLNASIDEFRVYNGPLTAAQIAADYALGPNQVIGTDKNVSLAAASAGDGNVVIKWPTTSALVTVMSSPVLGPGAVWTPVSNGTMTVADGNYQMTIPVSSSAQFFRLQQ